jgi:two-component system nitrate/nitrite response regulator NarL
MTTRLLVVDDHLLMREGLVRMLNGSTGFEVVGEAGNGFDAVELAHKLRPDVVLMDMYLPGMDGIGATKLIVRDLPDVKVILLTASENDEDILEAIRAGAKGYVLKDDSTATVIQQLRKVATGGVALSEDLAGKLIAELSRRPKASLTPSAGPMEDLTAREKQVLALVSRGMANKQIAHELTISQNTARAHIRNLMQKIYVDNRTQLAVYGVREGITWKSDAAKKSPEPAASFASIGSRR